MFRSFHINDIDFNNKEKAVSFLYKECYPIIRKYILHNRGSVDDAKDIFQETIIVFMSKLAHYQGTNVNVKALITTIAKNKWTDFVRKSNKSSSIDNGNFEELAESIAADLSVLDEDRNNQINKIFETVGERCKELLINILFYDYSMKDVAEKMGFSNENSAKTQHYKCKQKLIDNFKDNLQLKQYLKSFI